MAATQQQGSAGYSPYHLLRFRVISPTISRFTEERERDITHHITSHCCCAIIAVLVYWSTAVLLLLLLGGVGCRDLCRRVCVHCFVVDYVVVSASSRFFSAIFPFFFSLHLLGHQKAPLGQRELHYAISSVLVRFARAVDSCGVVSAAFFAE